MPPKLNAEELARDRLGEFRDDSTSLYQDGNALKEAHVFAMLAVAEAIDELAYDFRARQD